MTLPHPHGSSSGQIGHNSSFDTGATPGSTGGKFIGFGEDGTSANANRAHWALSENIDYLYQIMAAERALPAAASWTVPGGGSSSFQLTGEIFVGDSSYPGSAGSSDPEGMQLLFSVLDDQYNELTDGSDNEVRVAVVRDSANTTDVYKGGFETDAYLTFKTVDPTTGVDVQNPYTIPAATDVRILYAEQGTLENLPVDSFIRYKVHSGAEAEAGTLLQDGTRKMTGNLDLDGNDIINVDDITGPTATDMLIRSLQNMEVRADSALTLKDQYLAAAIPLSETGETAPAASQFTSLVGMMNNNLRVMRDHVLPNRCRNTTGSVTNDPVAGSITTPALDVVVGGEQLTVAVTVSAIPTPTHVDTDSTLVVNASGVLEFKLNSAVLDTDIPIVAFSWDGSTQFYYIHDVRTPIIKRVGSTSVSVGNHPYADFTDLQDAVNAVAHRYNTGDDAIIPEIVILGEVQITSTVVLPYLALAPNFGNDVVALKVRGAGPKEKSIIRVPNGSGAFINPGIFDCVASAIHIEDLTFIWDDAASQSGGRGVIYNPGHGSVFRNIQVKRGTSDKGFSDFIHVDWVDAEALRNDLLANLTEVYWVLENVRAQLRSVDTSYLIAAEATDIFDIATWTIWVDKCVVEDANCIELLSTGGPTNSLLDIMVRDTRVLYPNTLTTEYMFHLRPASGVFNGNESRVQITGCLFNGIPARIVDAAEVGDLFYTENTDLEGPTGSTVYADTNVRAHVMNNQMVHPGTTGNEYAMIYIGDETLFGSIIANNRAESSGVGAGTAIFLNRAECIVKGNSFDGGGALGAETFVVLGSGADNCIIQGNFAYGYQDYLVDARFSSVSRVLIKDNVFRYVSQTDSDGAIIFDGTNAEDIIIDGNTFDLIIPTVIFIADEANPTIMRVTNNTFGNVVGTVLDCL